LRARLGETICGIYDNCTTILIKVVENPIRRLSDPLRGVVEEMSVAFEHHARIRVAKATRDGKRVLACLNQ